MAIYSRFNRPRKSGLDFSGSRSLTQPQFLRDTDVNFLVRRYLGGDMSVLNPGRSLDVDVSNAPESLHDALNRMSEADFLWQSVPEPVRASYGSRQAFIAAYEAFLAKSADPSTATFSDQSVAQPEKKETTSTDVTPKGEPAA